jgi:hypothetical protein
MFDRSLNPGRGNALGEPPVARMSLVYGYVFPDVVETNRFSKSTPDTSSFMVLTEMESNHSWERNCSFDASEMRALESLVRSIGRYGSEWISVTGNLHPFSRNAWIAPMDPLPLPCHDRQPQFL